MSVSPFASGNFAKSYNLSSTTTSPFNFNQGSGVPSASGSLGGGQPLGYDQNALDPSNVSKMAQQTTQMQNNPGSSNSFSAYSGGQMGLPGQGLNLPAIGMVGPSSSVADGKTNAPAATPGYSVGTNALNAPQPAASNPSSIPGYDNAVSQNNQLGQYYNGLYSQLQNVVDPYNGQYRDSLIDSERGGIQSQYDNALNQGTASLASRGLMQGNTNPGLEQQMATETNIARNNALGQLNANAQAQMTQQQAQFEMQRANMEDQFNLARAQGQTGAAQDILNNFQNLAKLPGQLGQTNLQNAVLSSQNTLLGTQNQLLGTQNAAEQQNMDFTKQLFPGQLQQQQIQTEIGKMNADQQKQMIDWWNQNSWWAGPADFVAKIAQVAGPTVAAAAMA